MSDANGTAATDADAAALPPATNNEPTITGETASVASAPVDAMAPAAMETDSSAPSPVAAADTAPLAADDPTGASASYAPATVSVAVDDAPPSASPSDPAATAAIAATSETSAAGDVSPTAIDLSVPRHSRDYSRMSMASDDSSLSFGSSSFNKTLQSDVNDAHALSLLRDAARCDTVFDVFGAADLERLARCLSVLRCDSGEKIITAGEQASFCGIVLEGTFYAVLSDTHKISLTRSALVGEMSYWEGGIRTADIVVAPADESDPTGSGSGGAGSGGGVLAVISFEDLRRLQQVDGELAAKFLHLLAVVSIRKLRNMLKPPAAPSAAAASAAAVNAAPLSPSFASSAAPIAPVPPASTSSSAAAAAEDTASVAQKESLFLTRLRKEAADAQLSAHKLQAKSNRLTKAKRDTEYRVANLEHKTRALERELEESQLECKRNAEGARLAREKVKTLEESLAAAAARAAEVDAQLSSLQSAHSAAQSAHSALAARLHEETAQWNGSRAVLESRLDSALAESKTLRARLASVESSSQASLASLRESNAALDASKTALESAQRVSLAELDSLRAQLLVAEQRVLSLDLVRRELTTRLDEEALALAAWKSKADLHLGDLTRLQTHLRDNEMAVVDAVAERRATQRLLAHARSLLKKLIVRNFIRSARTRKLIFAIFARVNHVSTARLEAEGEAAPDSDMVGSTGGPGSSTSSASRFGGAMVSATQSVSLRQMRKERTRLMAFLRAERTPVSRLVWLLDEELTAFESPFLALQNENAQLRHTLDAFFQRNVALMAHFMAAKNTYEALHAEYAKLRESWQRMSRREKARARDAQAAGGGAGGSGQGQQGTLVSFDTPATPQQQTPQPAQQQQVSQLSSFEDEAPPPSFAPSFPAPPPFSPAALSAAALRAHTSGGGQGAGLGHTHAAGAQQMGDGHAHSRAAIPHQQQQTQQQEHWLQRAQSPPEFSRPVSSTPHRVAPSPSPPASSRTAASLGSPRAASRPGTSASTRGGGGVHAHGPPMSPLASPVFDAWHDGRAQPAHQTQQADVGARSQALRERIHSLTASGGGGGGGVRRPSSSPHARPSPAHSSAASAAAQFHYSHAAAAAASPPPASPSARLMSPSGAFYDQQQSHQHSHFTFAPPPPSPSHGQRPASGYGYGAQWQQQPGALFGEEKSPRFQQAHHPHPLSPSGAGRPASSRPAAVPQRPRHAPAAAGTAAAASPYPHVQHHALAHAQTHAAHGATATPPQPSSGPAQSYDQLFARR